MVDWNKIRSKLKTSTQRKAEDEEMRQSEADGIRRMLQEWAAAFDRELDTLHGELVAIWPTRVNLGFGGGGQYKKVFIDDDNLSLGVRPSEGLSISFLVNGHEEKIVFSQNLGHFERVGDSTHNAVDVKKRFDDLVESFVDQVKVRLPS